MDAFKSLVQPLVGGAGGSGVIDGMKLVVLGGTVETARRVSSSAWSHFVNSFFLTAHFSEEDYPYDWLMLWLSRRPEWQRSREFETTTRSTTPGFSSKIADNSFGDEDYLDGDNENQSYWGADDDDAPGKVKTRVVFQPTFDTTHTIYYRGHWLRIKRSRKQDGCEVLSVSVVSRSNTILKQLVLQAKREYEAEAIHRIQIYFADSHGSWRWTDSRHKRPMSSIVLNPGVKEMLLSDTKDFLASEKWYADRGIPFRRGYLLYGVPGSGKSSLIHAIAGELMLDIYVVSLSSSWINDSTLTTLMGRVPARCIVLLEDLDAAFTRSVTRESKKDKAKSDNNNSSGSGNTDSNGSNGRSRRSRRKDDSMSDTNTLSLSGLLNALDGVAAAEGRILFATTNHLDRLDPALSRPGRMDVWVEFKNASKWQAEALFRNFFPSTEEDDASSTSGSSRSSMGSRATSLSGSRATSPEAEGRSRAISISSSAMTQEEDISLTREEEDELAKLGIQLPNPPSQSPSPASQVSLLPNSSRPTSVHESSSTLRAGFPSPPPRTESASSFGSWTLPSSMSTPSVSSVTSALWNLPNSLASSSVSLLAGGAPPEAAARRSSLTKELHPTPVPIGSGNESYIPPPPPDSPRPPIHRVKPLSKLHLTRLAKKFADAIPDEEFSVAALQGYLLKNKSRPDEAADEAGKWVEDEREGRRKREVKRKEKAVKRENRKKKKAAKEKAEKEKKEREEKEKAEKEREEKEKAEKEKAEKEKEVQKSGEVAAVPSASDPASTSVSPPPVEPSPPPPPPPPPAPEPIVAPMPVEPAPASTDSNSSDSESESDSDDDSDDDDSDEENLPPGVRSRKGRAGGWD